MLEFRMMTPGESTWIAAEAGRCVRLVGRALCRDSNHRELAHYAEEPGAWMIDHHAFENLEFRGPVSVRLVREDGKRSTLLGTYVLFHTEDGMAIGDRERLAYFDPEQGVWRQSSEPDAAWTSLIVMPEQV